MFWYKEFARNDNSLFQTEEPCREGAGYGLRVMYGAFKCT